MGLGLSRILQRVYMLVEERVLRKVFNCFGLHKVLKELIHWHGAYDTILHGLEMFEVFCFCLFECRVRRKRFGSGRSWSNWGSPERRALKDAWRTNRDVVRRHVEDESSGSRWRQQQRRAREGGVGWKAGKGNQVAATEKSRAKTYQDLLYVQNNGKLHVLLWLLFLRCVKPRGG